MAPLNEDGFKKRRKRGGKAPLPRVDNTGGEEEGVWTGARENRGDGILAVGQTWQPHL